MNWAELGLGVVISTVQALLLWLFLPRGAVLTRTLLSDIRDGGKHQPVEDRWLVRNDSPVTVRLLSATLITPSGCKAAPSGEEGPLHLDDETSEITRNELGTPWSKVTLWPGEAMIAHVGSNQRLEIKYRRAGWAGMLERREIRMDGGV